jgi:hypothetical protein
MGQNAKYPSRVDVFRIALDSGHSVLHRHDRFVPTSDIAGFACQLEGGRDSK